MPRCRKCHSRRVIKSGFRISKNGEKQRYQCKACGHVWVAKQKNDVVGYLESKEEE
jgi:transposase-like protein